MKLLRAEDAVARVAQAGDDVAAVSYTHLDVYKRQAMHSVEFEQTVAMAADDMPTKALVNIQGSFPTGSTLQVWICLLYTSRCV